MRNRYPDGSPYVPQHLQGEWKSVSKELQDASEEFNRADARYREGYYSYDEASWALIVKSLNKAYERRLDAIRAKFAVIDKINGRET